MKKEIEFSGGYITGHDEERSHDARMEIYEYEKGWEIPELAVKCHLPIRREYHGMGCNSIGKYPVHSYHVQVASPLDFARKVKQCGLFPKTHLFSLAREIETDWIGYRSAKPNKPPKFFGINKLEKKIKEKKENKKDWLLRVACSIQEQFEQGLGNPPEREGEKENKE